MKEKFIIKRGNTFRILTHEAFRPLVEAKGIIYKKLDTDAADALEKIYSLSICSLPGSLIL